jgi:hypothetical protein
MRENDGWGEYNPSYTVSTYGNVIMKFPCKNNICQQKVFKGSLNVIMKGTNFSNYCWGVAHVVECLLSKCRTRVQIPLLPNFSIYYQKKHKNFHYHQFYSNFYKVVK